MDKFIAIIPARYASTRFPGKPLVDILGKPMIQHVFERASAIFEDCYVATDDNRIADIVKSFGGKVVMTSAKHRSGTDRCREALDIIELEQKQKYNVVVNIQGDEPFIDIEQLQQIATCFREPATDIATLVKPFSKDEDIFNPNSPKVVLSENSYALYFSRSVIPYLRGVESDQWAQKHTFFKHIGLYAYRANVLRKIAELPVGKLETAESLEQLRWLENGYKIKVAITNMESYSIDTPEDLSKVIHLFSK